MKTISQNKMHGGVQAIYEHRSDACDCDMRVGVFTPEDVTNAVSYTHLTLPTNREV